MIVLAPIFLLSVLSQILLSPFNEEQGFSNSIVYEDYIPKHSLSITPSTVILPDGIISEPKSGLQIHPQEILVMQGLNNTIFWKNNDKIPISIQENDELFHFTINAGNSYGRGFDVGEYQYHVESNPEINGKITVVPKPFEKLHRPTAAGDDFNQWNSKDLQKLSSGGSAFTTTNGHMQDWYGFFQNIPTDKSISGIEVLISATSTGISDSGIKVELSWDGGNTYTITENQYIWNISDHAVQRFGGGK